MTKHDPAGPARASPEALRQQGQAAGRRFDPELGRRIALAYDELLVGPNTYERLSWDAMARDEVKLFTRATMEYHIQPWPREGQPYTNSTKMREDVLWRKHLYVFTGGGGHPVRTFQETYRGRAVHDIYTHALPGNDFSPDGELAAFIESEKWYTPPAIPALATDNLGPTAWYYFHPSNDGKPHTERQWSVQKGGLLPRELWEELLT